ncbi:hypothetical protein KIN20_007055 [Parelaphostrongylus tenuis]|uniref:Uncharacterized protein n=1 Tax=Parelaphostrongylus tenuis TaxID=148309 RepID=A0AAD5MV19_PARTN|nr:hypothetical protein KIN20_007055 [Parelaphostrongylus tenuis]
MNIFLNGSHLTSPERSQFTNTNTTLSSSPDTVTNFTSQTTFKTRKNSDDQAEKRSAYSISNILEKKQNSPIASSSSASDDDTGSPRCGSTEDEHGSTSTSDVPTTSVFPHFLFPSTAFSTPSTVSELSTPMIMHNSIDISPAQLQQAYLSFLVGQQLNSAAAVAAANPLRILAQDQEKVNDDNGDGDDDVKDVDFVGDDGDDDDKSMINDMEEKIQYKPHKY